MKTLVRKYAVVVSSMITLVVVIMTMLIIHCDVNMKWYQAVIVSCFMIFCLYPLVYLLIDVWSEEKK